MIANSSVLAHQAHQSTLTLQGKYQARMRVWPCIRSRQQRACVTPRCTPAPLWRESLESPMNGDGKSGLSLATMKPVLKEKLVEVLQAVSPLVASVCLLQFTVVHAPADLFLQFLIGALLAVAGMMLLFVGIDEGIVPMGRFVGAELPKRRSLVLMLVVAFSIGFATTVPEPDVLVLSDQVQEASAGAISSSSMIYAIALGVGMLAALATARIVLGWSMRGMLAAGYALAIVLALFAPRELVSLAFDGGSVTTGVLSAPVIIALALGVSSVLGGRSTVSDGFGVVGFASVGPMLIILILGMLRS
jgi:hypothetical protein